GRAPSALRGGPGFDALRRDPRLPPRGAPRPRRPPPALRLVVDRWHAVKPKGDGGAGQLVEGAVRDPDADQRRRARRRAEPGRHDGVRSSPRAVWHGSPGRERLWLAGRRGGRRGNSRNDRRRCEWSPRRGRSGGDGPGGPGPGRGRRPGAGARRGRGARRRRTVVLGGGGAAPRSAPGPGGVLCTTLILEDGRPAQARTVGGPTPSRWRGLQKGRARRPW